MNESELALVEQRLGISVPASYKTLFLSRFDELQSTGFFGGDLSCLFLQTATVIDYNQMERADDAGTHYAFPGWWETFFLVGTNGAGDFYALRLDGSAEVWMIGSDCGDEPTLISPSLDNFVNDLIVEFVAAHEAKKRVELEQARRREPFQLEFAAHRAAIDKVGGMAVAEPWFGATNCRRLFQLLNELPYKTSPRKLRLLGLAGCRRVDACREDADLSAALHLAEQLTLGTASEAEVRATRQSLRDRREKARTSAERWPVTAVHDLFQEDRDYLNGSGIYPHDPELLGALSAVNYSLHGSPHGTIAECELFWEILGFPFLEIPIDPAWRSPAVMTTASHIFTTQDFSQMPKLAAALQAAGCDDARLLAHCGRATGHARGCWVIDLLLENEPNPFHQKFTWDFECNHPTIDATALKEKLKQLGAARHSNSSDVKARLEFADWLQSQGDDQWADYIRVRCALDGPAPGDDYADLVEKQIECAIDLEERVRIDFQDIYHGGHLESDSWWSSETYDYYGGLPCMVHAVSPGEDSAGPPAVLIQRLHALMQQTPVRGVDFEEHYTEDVETIFRSSDMSDLRLLDFENNSRKETVSPVVAALPRASFAPALECLSIQNGLSSDDEAYALAGTTFECLRRLDMKYGKIDCSAKAAETLLTSSWFKQLEQLYCGIGDACAEVAMRELQRMSRLHSLALFRLPQPAVLAFTDKEPMPALRRLALMQTDLTGDAGRAFCGLALPGLIELSLSGCKASLAELNTILSSPLTNVLQVLNLGQASLNEKSLDKLARTPCASQLRILSLECGDSSLNGKFKSLGTSALAGDAFAALTTLKVSDPYTAKAIPDTAGMLNKLVAPNLRHLTLEACDFDDQCADAVCNNPSFAKLTRLRITQKYKSVSLLSPKAAEALFRCTNLQNLLELEFSQLRFGDAISFMADPSVLPSLKSAAFSGTQTSEETQKEIMDKRPIVYVGS